MGSYEHSSLISHAQDYQLPIAAVLSYQSCKLFFIKNIPQYSLASFLGGNIVKDILGGAYTKIGAVNISYSFAGSYLWW